MLECLRGFSDSTTPAWPFVVWPAPQPEREGPALSGHHHHVPSTLHLITTCIYKSLQCRRPLQTPEPPVPPSIPCSPPAWGLWPFPPARPARPAGTSGPWPPPPGRASGWGWRRRAPGADHRWPGVPPARRCPGAGHRRSPPLWREPGQKCIKSEHRSKQATKLCYITFGN